MNTIWRHIRPALSLTVRFFRISYLEARSDYEGTRIGLFWMPLSTLIFAGLLGTVFHNPGPVPLAEFFLYVLCGYATWTFISDTISTSINIIQTKFDFAVHSGLSMGALFAKVLVDRLFEYGVNLLVVIAALLLLRPWGFTPALALFPLLIVLMGASSLALSYLINLITLFFPDMSTIIKTGARVMFFATPVFWTSGQEGGVKLLLERFNPAAYYLKMAREVFGLEAFDVSVWVTGVTITAALSVVGYVAFRRTEQFARNVK